MKPLSAQTIPNAANRRVAFIVLVVALVATIYVTWREHELARRGQIIRWQDGVAQLNPVLSPLLGQHFDQLRDHARTTLRRGSFSQEGWNEFLISSEWQQRFPGMQAIGYAEFGGDRCIVRFLASSNALPVLAPGSDLMTNAIIHEAVQRSANAGYGSGSGPLQLVEGSNAVNVIVGLVPLRFQDTPTGTASENRANLRGFIFFALDQQAFFRSCQQLKSLPFDLRLLAPDETAPPSTATQRAFTHTGIAGEWRFVATMKSVPARAAVPQWIALFGGIALSWLMFALFSTQARLRFEAERASEKILLHEAEIIALNRDLESKITIRTAELHDALAEEKELNRLKSNFISMVTHEIRTPLALILGSSEILSRYLERLAPDKRSEHLKTIDSAVQRMSALLEDVLLFSKAEAGRMDFNPVAMDLKNFCTQLTDEIASATNRRCPIELSVVEVSEPARSDENLLRHIFANLLSNATKYSSPGTLVKFSVTRDLGDAVFTVQDRGMGIPENDRKRLFVPFYRGKNVATIQGTGLGLVIVKHCIERHGGIIEIASAEHAGTTVTVRLPLFSPSHTEFIKRISQDTTE